MKRGKVRILKARRAVPKLVQGQDYEVVLRQGKEFILDGYSGWVPLANIKECDVEVVNL